MPVQQKALDSEKSSLILSEKGFLSFEPNKEPTLFSKPRNIFIEDISTQRTYWIIVRQFLENQSKGVISRIQRLMGFHGWFKRKINQQFNQSKTKRLASDKAPNFA